MAQIKRLGLPFTSLLEKHQLIGKISNIFYLWKKGKINFCLIQMSFSAKRSSRVLSNTIGQ